MRRCYHCWHDGWNTNDYMAVQSRDPCIRIWVWCNLFIVYWRRELYIFTSLSIRGNWSTEKQAWTDGRTLERIKKKNLWLVIYLICINIVFFNEYLSIVSFNCIKKTILFWEWYKIDHVLLLTGINKMFIVRRDQIIRDDGDVLPHRIHKQRFTRQWRRREYRSRLCTAERNHYRCRGIKVFLYVYLTKLLDVLIRILLNIKFWFFPAKDRIFHFFCLVSCRFERPIVMEYQDILITPQQNTVDNGWVVWNSLQWMYLKVQKMFVKYLIKRLYVCTIDMDPRQVEARKKSTNCAFYGRNSMARNIIRSTRKRWRGLKRKTTKDIFQ